MGCVTWKRNVQVVRLTGGCFLLTDVYICPNHNLFEESEKEEFFWVDLVTKITHAIKTRKEEIISGEEGEMVAAMNPDSSGGIARASDSTLVLSPIISPCFSGEVIFEIMLGILASEKPFAMARNGMIKSSSTHEFVKN